MRGFELDVFNDPEGGRFYNRQGLRFINEPVESNIPELLEPGLKVLHIPDVDYETHHYTFRSALQTIAAWSDAHPNHAPLAIHIETKEGTIADAAPTLGLTTAVPFDAAAAAAIDTEIRAVFADTRIITPDEVRGAHATLEEAVLTDGWPTLAAARGRVLFFMEGAAVDEYVAGAPGLVGRLVFANSQPGDPHAAVMIVNDSLRRRGHDRGAGGPRLHRPHAGRRQHQRGAQRRREPDERRAGERRPDRQHRLLPPGSARQHRRQRLDELQGEAPRRRPGAHQPGEPRRRSRPHLRIVAPRRMVRAIYLPPK